MALVKRPGSRYWWYSIYRGDKLPRLRGSTGKTDKKEALAVEHVVGLAFQGKTHRDRLVSMIDALVGKVHDGLPLPGVWAVYEEWMRSAGRGMADITRRQRRRACERFADWAGDNWPAVACAGEVDRACAAGFASWLANQGSSGKTRRNLIADLGTVWEGMRRVRDDVKENPWPLVLPKNDSERLEAFNKEQETAIFKAAEDVGHGWGLACRIARYTGLRYGDIARLKWESVCLKEGVIRLAPSKTERHGIGVVIPLCTSLRTELELAKAVVSEGDGLFVLPEHAKCYPYPNKGAPGAFAEVLKKAKVVGEGFTFHSWRHTFRSSLAAAGVSDEIAKRLGGWTEDATARRYDHDGRIKEMREAVEMGAGGGRSKKAGMPKNSGGKGIKQL